MTLLPKTLHRLAAIGGPFVFSFGRGHFRSALLSRAVDRAGHPLPWYTYGAIDYLTQLDFSDADILEFGGGQSTLWWSARAKSVTCLESSPAWGKKLEQSVRGAGSSVHLVKSPAHTAESVAGYSFDVIVVDDGSGVGPRGRVDNAKTALSRIRPGGLIIIDNADADYCRSITEEMYSEGWTRIDFFGFAPGSFGESCTSVYFKEVLPWLRPNHPPRLQR